MEWLLIVFVVLALLAGLWAFVLAPPESAESAARARQQAQATSLAKRLGEAYDEAQPLVLVLGAAPAPNVLEWVRAGAALESPRTLAVRGGQDLLELLVAATGEELPRETVRDGDADAHRTPSFAARQHPLAGRIDAFEAAPLDERLLPLLRRWVGDGRAELASSLVEFGSSDIEAEPDAAAVAAVEALIERGAAPAGDDDDPTHQAATLVRPLLEAAEAARAAGHSLALLWLPAAEAIPVALEAIAPEPAPPTPEAPPTDLEPARVEEALRALGAELAARALRAGRDPDGGFTLEGAPLRVRAWPYLVESTRAAVALEVEANLEGERRTFRHGMAAQAPSAEHALRQAISAGVGVVLPPLLDACAAPREDVVRWSPPARSGDAPTAYEVHLGPLSLQGRAAPEQLDRLLQRHPFLALRDALGPQLARRLHVVDLRAARTAGGPVEAEVRLDGAPWPEGAAALSALTWPDDAPHVGVRAVTVLRAARQ